MSLLASLVGAGVAFWITAAVAPADFVAVVAATVTTTAAAAVSPLPSGFRVSPRWRRPLIFAGEVESGGIGRRARRRGREREVVPVGAAAERFEGAAQQYYHERPMVVRGA